MPKPAKRDKPIGRNIRMLRSPARDGVGVVEIVIRRETWYYLFREIECVIGGRGFMIRKSGFGPEYDVRVGEPEHCSCECLGFLRHGRCKHIQGLLALIENGKV